MKSNFFQFFTITMKRDGKISDPITFDHLIGDQKVFKKAEINISKSHLSISD